MTNLKKVLLTGAMLITLIAGCSSEGKRTLSDVQISSIGETQLALENGTTIFSTEPSIQRFRSILEKAKTNKNTVTISLERCSQRDEMSYFAYIENVQ